MRNSSEAGWRAAFVAAMMAGMVLYAWVFERPDRGGVISQIPKVPDPPEV